MTALAKISAAHGVAGPLLGLAASSSLRTPCGARRVENVRPGDLVVTRDNGLQPVRFVWSRKVSAMDISADPSLAPVRLKPRAIGPMMPQRDLLLAGSHRILVPGYRLADVPDLESRLISARDLAEVSDAAFVDKSVGDITFYNIVFDEHQVFCVDGLPVESYIPNAKDLRLLSEPVRERLTSLFEVAPGVPKVLQGPRYRIMTAQECRPEFV